MKPTHQVNQIVVWKYTMCKTVAISPRTGGLTIELLADCAPYKMGDRVNVMPYDVLIHAPAAKRA